MKILFPGLGLFQFMIGSTVFVHALSEEPALAGVIPAMSVFCLMLSWLCFHHLAEIDRLTRFVEMKRAEENVEILKRNPELTDRRSAHWKHWGTGAGFFGKT
jgi:hypothetical protein